MMRMTTAVMGVLAVATAAQGQSIVNGSLTGPVGSAIQPPAWFAVQNTPDTCDASGPFNNTPNPWVLSPDGGTFVRAGGSDLIQSEVMAQDVTGFTPGASYDLEFFMSNLGFQHPSSGAWIGEDGYWSLYIDGVLAGATGFISKPVLNTDANVWIAESISFVAPAADFEVRLMPRSGGGLAAYMAIDGISVRAVPAPGALALFAAGGLFALRRRH
ncbi:MAG: PEP-CTERM sorting domain-containing protein [Phycisphaerales bacterium]|nr:PEP-CTERM sorting domain-containing protein [Phycisphaerales bacterium]